MSVRGSFGSWQWLSGGLFCGLVSCPLRPHNGRAPLIPFVREQSQVAVVVKVDDERQRCDSLNDSEIRLRPWLGATMSHPRLTGVTHCLQLWSSLQKDDNFCGLSDCLFFLEAIKEYQLWAFSSDRLKAPDIAHSSQRKRQIWNNHLRRERKRMRRGKRTSSEKRVWTRDALLDRPSSNEMWKIAD